MDPILTGIWRWESQDEEGVIMASYAIEDPGSGTLVLDPAWDAVAVSRLEKMTRPLRIVVTTGNHIRDARRYRSRLAVPIAASAATARDMEDANRVLEPGERLPGGWEVVAAPGVYEGEVALYRAREETAEKDAAVLYVGDVVLGVSGPEGEGEAGVLAEASRGMGKEGEEAPDTPHLVLLRERLVADPARLRDTLFYLSRMDVDVLLMGHGRPILAEAGSKLSQLLRR